MITLLIDVGMTLLGGPKQSPATFICEVLGLPKESKTVVADVVFCQEYDEPNGLIHALSVELRRQVSDGQKAAIADYWERQQTECLPIPGAERFCDEIIKTGYCYYIVSNLWEPFYKALRTHLPNFVSGSNGAFLSYKIGSRKPSDLFYAQVFDMKYATPADFIMIGDSMDNDIIPCVSRGARAVLLDFSTNKARRHPENAVSALDKSCLRVANNYEECLEHLKTL